MTNTPAPPSGPLPIVEEEQPGDQRGPLLARIRDALRDPVLGTLIISTFVMTLGRGVFIALSVLYLSLVVGLPAAQVALLLFIAGAVGVATSYLGGHIADRFSARRLLLAFVVAEAIVLMCYPLATSFTSALVISCLVTAFERAANSVRGAIIARAFTGPRRVSTRAILRTVTNIGIAIGGFAGGAALLIKTPDAYRITMVAAGVLAMLSAIRLIALPATVDAARHREKAAKEGAPTAGIPPFKNPAYLALTVLSGIFGMQFGLAEIGLPLWIVQDTEAPTALYSVLLITNTVLVIAFQVPLSRGTHDIRFAGKISLVAGALMLVACGLYASSAAVGIALAITLLVLGMVAHTFAEILSSASNWGLSFELAEPSMAGAYQGLFAMGFSLGAMAAPLGVTATVLQHGVAGWAGLALLFAAAATGIWWITLRTRA